MLSFPFLHADDHDHAEHAEHGHSHSEGGVWEGFIGLLTDPAHLLFELTFTLVFDLVVVALIYGVIVKKYIIPKLKLQISRDVHSHHGLVDDACEDDGGEPPTR